MHLEGAGLAEHPHLGALGVAADDRVVDDDDPLAADHVLEGVELEADAELAQGLAGLDEGAADVGVLDEALAVGDAGLLGEARRRRACRTRAPASPGRRRRGARGPAGGPSPPAPRGRCGRRWWRRGGRGRRTRTRSPSGPARANLCERRPFSSMTISSPGSTSRTMLAPTVARAASSLATTQPRASRPRTSGRMPCGSRAAYRCPRSSRRSEKAPWSCGQHLERALLERGVGVVRQQRGDQAGVVGGALDAGAGGGRARPARWGARRPSPGSSWVLIRLPLWPSAIEPSAVGRKVGWAFFQVLRAGGGVAAVADRDVADQAGRASTRRRPGRPGPCPCRRGSGGRC